MSNAQKLDAQVNQPSRDLIINLGDLTANRVMETWEHNINIRSLNTDTDRTIYLPPAVKCYGLGTYTITMEILGAGKTVTVADSVLGPGMMFAGNVTLDEEDDTCSFISDGASWVKVNDNTSA